MAENFAAVKGAQDQRPHCLGTCDITESNDHWRFRIDCPGFTKKDVRVRVSGKVLHISGERSVSNRTADEHYVRVERSHGSFHRMFNLPQNIDLKGIKANCDHGILEVSIPKTDDFNTGEQIVITDGQGDGSLNSDFEAVPLSVFPTPALGKLVVINSDTPIVDAVKQLSKHSILAAPVRDVTQPDDASWTDKYLGILDMVGVVFYMLDTLEPEGKEPEDFEKEITNCEAFRGITAGDCTKFNRFSEFIPVDNDTGTLLDPMLLCGEHHIRRVPVVKSPGGDLQNIITQSALVQTLSANLPRFSAVGKKTLKELGLGSRSLVWSVDLEMPLKQAFKLIQDKGISAVPVVDKDGKIRGNISARDARLIVSSQKIYKLLNMPIRIYLDVISEGADNSAIHCSPSDTMEAIIYRMVQSRIHRIYLVDEQLRPIRVISLSDIIRKFVREPQGYFGRFFA